MTHPIPDKALAQHIAVLGKTGSGKSYAIRGVVERLLDEESRCCVIDPTGTWWGLKSSATGKSGGYPVVIFGGTHADLPLGAAHGEALAEAIGTSSTPAILDTSQMKVGERTRFFADFADALVRKNKGPLHLVIDEAHLFAPQGKVNDPQSGAMLHAANNLVSLGRSRGLRIVLITQRPAKLHKDSLTQVETLVAMRLIAPQDRKAVEEWIKDNADQAKGQEVISSLATLKTGQAWVWAPELGVLERVQFPRIHTFDSSKAPDDAGDGAGPVLAPIDREAIAARLKTVAIEADANDPKKLRARIAELERQARDIPKNTEKLRQDAAKDRQDVAAAEQRGYERGCQAGREAQVALLANVRQSIEALVGELGRDVGTMLGELQPVELRASAPPRVSTPVKTPVLPGVKPTPPRRPIAHYGGDNGARPPVQQRVLDALAELEQIGAASPDRELAAFMANYSNVTSKGFANAIGALRTAGLIDYPTPGQVVLTTEGRAAANPPERPRSPEELQERVIGMLGGASGRVLRPLIEAYPKSVERQELAEAAGYGNVTSKGFANAMGRLRTLGFIDYPDRGTVAARPVLFLQ